MQVSADEGVSLRYAEIPRIHWYYGRILGMVAPPGHHSLPHPSTLKAFEAAVALRRLLRAVVRELGPIDLLEVLEAVAYPRLFRAVSPYTVKLHSADFTLKHFCGEGLGPADRQRIQLESALLRHALLVTSPSAALADHVAEFCNYPRERITVLPYPLDISHFCPAPDSARSSIHPPSVLFVGRLVWRKGLKTLAQAAGSVLAVVPDATIDIVGGETEEVTFSGLRDLVPEPFRHRLIFHGRVPHSDLAGLYRDAARAGRALVRGRRAPDLAAGPG